MLKSRVIITLCFRDGVLFRTKRFVPDYRYSANFIDIQNCDEAVLIDVGQDRKAFLERVETFIDDSMTPATVGGRINSVEEAVGLVKNQGADKIVINSAAVKRPKLLSELADKLGSQSVVVGIDCAGDSIWFNHRDMKSRNIRPVDWATQVEKLGAGEIFLQDVTRDGSLSGYNIPLVEEISNAVSIPVVIGSGCGTWGHMQQAFEAGASGASTSVIHHLSASALAGAKQWLVEKGAEVRPA